MSQVRSLFGPPLFVTKAERQQYDRDWYHTNKRRIDKNKKASRKRFRDKVTAFVNEAKNVPCKDCGNTYPPCVMDFDHLENKAFTIANSKSLGIEALKAEIAKCDVVCANCHRIRTHIGM